MTKELAQRRRALARATNVSIDDPDVAREDAKVAIFQQLQQCVSAKPVEPVG
jgi:hypothetical protein